MDTDQPSKLSDYEIIRDFVLNPQGTDVHKITSTKSTLSRDSIRGLAYNNREIAWWYDVNGNTIHVHAAEIGNVPLPVSIKLIKLCKHYCIELVGLPS